jgi:hypothetical protein
LDTALFTSPGRLSVLRMAKRHELRPQVGLRAFGYVPPPTIA